MSQWSEYPCLFAKTNPDHKDQNKWDIARQQIAESLNEALDYEKGADKFITGIFEFLTPPLPGPKPRMRKEEGCAQGQQPCHVKKPRMLQKPEPMNKMLVGG